MAADTWIRRLAPRIAADERADDGAAELLAQVEGHVRQPQCMARLPRGDHGRGRAACALGIRSARVDPEPQRHADRLSPRAQQRHGTVDAAAHRDRDPQRIGFGAEDLAQRVRERVGRERLARHGRRLEQGQPCDRALEPLGVGVDDPVTVDQQAYERRAAVARRVPDDLDQRIPHAPPDPGEL